MAPHHPVLGPLLRADVSDCHAARVESDSHLYRGQPLVPVDFVDLGHGLLHFHGAGNRVSGLARSGYWGSEHGENGIAQKLDNGAFSAQNDVGHDPQEVVDQPHHLFGRKAFGHGGEAAQVGHHDGDVLLLSSQLLALGRFEQTVHHVIGEISSEGLLNETAAQFELSPALRQGSHGRISLHLADVACRMVADAGDQLHRIRQFHQVVAGTTAETLRLGYALLLSGKHNDGDLTGAVVVAKRIEEGQPVDLGHDQVEKNDRGVALVEKLECLFRIETVHEQDILLFVQGGPDHFADQPLVIDDEHRNLPLRQMTVSFISGSGLFHYPRFPTDTSTFSGTFIDSAQHSMLSSEYYGLHGQIAP